ncbi:hypothetical protein PLCT2_02932 [Planctomycetaceae bacterium]|nr:hypothetical protein PLCT2_02932 [Planctomycetaceae bacterium]
MWSPGVCRQNTGQPRVAAPTRDVVGVTPQSSPVKAIRLQRFCGRDESRLARHKHTPENMSLPQPVCERRAGIAHQLRGQPLFLLK